MLCRKNLFSGLVVVMLSLLAISNTIGLGLSVNTPFKEKKSSNKVTCTVDQSYAGPVLINGKSYSYWELAFEDHGYPCKECDKKAHQPCTLEGKTGKCKFGVGKKNYCVADTHKKTLLKHRPVFGHQNDKYLPAKQNSLNGQVVCPVPRGQETDAAGWFAAKGTQCLECAGRANPAVGKQQACRLVSADGIDLSDNDGNSLIGICKHHLCAENNRIWEYLDEAHSKEDNQLSR